MKICIVTNIPAPYRVPIYNILNDKMGNDFLAIYCCPREDNRSWDLPKLKHQHAFLSKNEKRKNANNNYVHSNINVLYHLLKYKPDVVITTGFNPTHIFSWLYAVLFKKKHIPMTDGWIYSESFLSWKHKIIRKIFFKTSHGFIAASKNGFELYKSYGVDRKKIFKSHLCVNNDAFNAKKIMIVNRKYDFVFSGCFDDRKQPLFFLRVVREVAKYKQVKALMLGDGPLLEKSKRFIVCNMLDVECPGFVLQDELPAYYENSKLFLFPTRNDPWGVVVNEAFASGTPAIVSPFSGTTNDLVINGSNGFIVPLNEKKWVKKIIQLLDDPLLMIKLSWNAVNQVRKFNYTDAAQGIIDASFSTRKNS